MAEAYPLSWPVGFQRTKTPLESMFGDRSFSRSRDEIFAELGRLGAQKVILSTNVPLTKDGIPYANRGPVKDSGVAVYFIWKGKSRTIACDHWRKIEDNLHAITLTIGALRGLERWGASGILERAFMGLQALPAPPEENWATVLEVHESWSLRAIEDAYREKIVKVHPDLPGGSVSQTQRLNKAISEARSEKR